MFLNLTMDMGRKKKTVSSIFSGYDSTGAWLNFAGSDNTQVTESTGSVVFALGAYQSVANNGGAFFPIDTTGLTSVKITYDVTLTNAAYTLKLWDATKTNSILIYQAWSAGDHSAIDQVIDVSTGGPYTFLAVEGGSAGLNLTLHIEAGPAVPAPLPALRWSTIDPATQSLMSVEDVGTAEIFTVTTKNLQLLGPNDDNSYDTITTYYDSYWVGQQIVTTNALLQTSSVQSRPDKGAVGTYAEIWDAPKAAIGTNKKTYILTRDQPEWHIHTYQAQTKTWTFGAIYLPSYLGGGVSPIITGMNGDIFVGGGDGNYGAIMRINTTTDTVTEYRTLGTNNGTGVYGEHIFADDTHAYIITGRTPYRCIALNLSTGTHVELHSQDAVMELYPSRYGVSTAFNGVTKYLQGGVAYDTAPFSIVAGLPEDVFLPPKPTIDNSLAGLGGVDNTLTITQDGGAPFAYNYTVTGFQRNYDRLYNVNGELLIVSGGYQGYARHDLTTDVTTYVGKDGLSQYCGAVSGTKVIMSGYPNSPIRIYDSVSKTLSDASATWYTSSGVKKMLCMTVGGNGKIYAGGKWRDNGNRGGVGIYDVTLDAVSGFYLQDSIDIFANHQLVDCCAVGTYIVYSGYGWSGSDGKIFVLDTATDRIVNSWTPIVGNSNSHHILPYSATEIIAYSPTGALYIMDITTGTISKFVDTGFTFANTDSETPESKRIHFDGTNYLVRIGTVWAENMIVTIDSSLEISTSLGKTDGVAYPDKVGELINNGATMYMAGATVLKKFI